MYMHVHACTCMYLYTCVLGAGENLDHPVVLLVLMKLCPGEVTHYRPALAGETGWGLDAGAGGWDWRRDLTLTDVTMDKYRNSNYD